MNAETNEEEAWVSLIEEEGDDDKEDARGGGEEIEKEKGNY